MNGPTQDEREAVQAALDRALAREDYQTSIPRIERAAPPRVSVAPPTGLRILFGVLEVLLWAVGLLALALVVVHVARSWTQRVRRGVGASADDSAVGSHSRLAGRELVIDRAAIEALANEGRYGEAVHELLLLTLQSLCELARVQLRSGWTSREILREIPLPDGAGEALRDLVRHVELSHFGDAVPGRDDYELCLVRFEAFVIALRTAS
ncbi:MAG: hypothetical protein R3E53_00035 [Myxococcota bacterium]